jgi:hypothetical protein
MGINRRRELVGLKSRFVSDIQLLRCQQQQINEYRESLNARNGNNCW